MKIREKKQRIEEAAWQKISANLFELLLESPRSSANLVAGSGGLRCGRLGGPRVREGGVLEGGPRQACQEGVGPRLSAEGLEGG